MLAAWAAAVGIYDWRTRRIPNLALLVVLVPAVLAVAVNGHGLLGAGALSSLLGLLIVGLVMWPGYRYGQTGAGDVKFAACLGLLLGWKQGVEFVLIAWIAIALLSVAVLVWQRWRGDGRLDLKRRLPAGAAIAAAFCTEVGMGPLLESIKD